MSLMAAIINAILIGTVYALIASGLTIIYGVMRIVNFAHGHFVILASYTAFWLWFLFGVGPVIAIFIAFPLFFGLGIVLYFTTVVPLLNAEDTELKSFLAYFGLGIALLHTMQAFWGSGTRAIPNPYEGLIPLFITLYGSNIPTSRIIGAAISLTTIVLLLVFLYKTYLGTAIRALIQNRDAAKFLGIDVDRVSAISMGLGLGLAAIAGISITMIFPGFSPVLSEEYTIIAFAIIVLGGVDSPIGGIIAGIVFAFMEQLAMLYLSMTASPILAFVILVVIIMLRPEGLFRVKDMIAVKTKLRSKWPNKVPESP